MIIARFLFMHCERNKSFLSLFIVITIITIFKFLRNIPRRRMIMLINTQAQPAFDHLVRWSHFTRITWPIRPSKNYYIKYCYINVNRLTRNAHTRSLCIFFYPSLLVAYWRNVLLYNTYKKNTSSRGLCKEAKFVLKLSCRFMQINTTRTQDSFSSNLSILNLTSLLENSIQPS